MHAGSLAVSGRCQDQARRTSLFSISPHLGPYAGYSHHAGLGGTHTNKIPGAAGQRLRW